MMRTLVVVIALVAVLAMSPVGAESAGPSCSSNGSGRWYDVQLDNAANIKPFHHFWQSMVGSGHASLTLRADWREYMLRARKAIGYEFVRFHGIFDDDMSVVLSDNNGGVVYQFHNVDAAYDFLVSIGMKPLVELSFMPELLASNASQTIFHYKGGISPPKSYDAWADFMKAFAEHIIDRYGIQEVSSWLFEVWNEPNCGFWSGTQAEYFQLFNATVLALKSVSPLIRVGGPATCQSAWLPEWKKFVETNNIPVDFATTHEYPTDIQPVQKDIMKQVVTKAQAQVAPLPLLYTEFNDGLYYPGFHDEPFAAAFLTYNAQLLQSTGIPLMSYWCVSDVFEEQGFLSAPFNEGFGLQTLNGVAKPAFRALELLAQAGNFEFHTAGNNVGPNSTISVLATDRVEPPHIADFVFVTNFNIPGAPIATETVCLSFPGTRVVNGNNQHLSPMATIQRIDDDNANAKKLWLSWGSPMYLTPGQVGQLDDASALTSTALPLTAENGGKSYSVSISMPPLAVAVIEVSWIAQ